MHFLQVLLQLLRPQRRRVVFLVLMIAGSTAMIAAMSGLTYVLFTLLGAQAFHVKGALARFAFVQHAVALANRHVQGPPAARLQALGGFAVLVFIFGLLRLVFTYYRIYLGQYVGGRVLIDLRTRLFERLQALSLSFFESQRVGDLMSRLITDVALVQQMLTEDMTNYIMAPCVVIVCMGLMVATNWKLTLLLIVFAPLTVYVISRMGRRMRRLTRSQQERIGDLNARLHERLGSMRIIQSFTQERFEIENFRRLNENTFDAVIRVARVNALSPQLVQFLATLSLLLVALSAGTLIIHGQLSLPAMMMYFVLVQQSGVYFVRFGSLHLRVQQSLAALGRIVEVMEREPDVQERPGAKPLPHVEGRIAFRDVSFRYAEGEEVLHAIDLEIAPGEMVAVVGPSGAGKTSLANLVMRLYDPTRGGIEIDGHDIREVTLRSLRSQIGLVPQETILFGGTIRDNILYGNTGANEAAVIAAARAANAHDFIAALPHGYDTDVGEQAVKLSGGQRQRLAVARALLKDPRILILDEATSSLDAESEALVQEALERLMVGRTTLVIAHRLSTIRKASRILVLSAGRILEQGTHQQLLTAGGIYSRLYGKQQEPFVDVGG